MTAQIRFGLIAGILAGPLFYMIVLAQMATREGFSIWVHPISLLALGPGGLIQTLNFAITGTLFIASAAALVRISERRLQGGLLMLAGIGLVVVALNPADPYMGYPPGSTTVPDTRLSRHAQFHGLGFMLCFGCIVLASLATAFIDWRAGRARFAVLSFSVCVSVIGALSLGMSRIDYNSESFFVLGILAFGWISTLCWGALCRHAPPKPHESAIGA